MEKIINAGDLGIHYLEQGSGKPLVMIAGFTASLDAWYPKFLEELARSYRVITFDNRGAGLTVTPDEPQGWTMDLFASDTARFMEALGIEKAYVLGESMGGMIAQELAINYPERVEKLVLCCTFCGGEEAEFPSSEVIAVMADRSGTQEDIARRNIPLLFPDEWADENPEIIEDSVRRSLLHPMSEENVDRQTEALLTFSTYSRLPQIKCPTLIACGTADVMVPPENSIILADRIPNAKLIEYPGAGHAFTTQYAEEFAREIKAFLG